MRILLEKDDYEKFVAIAKKKNMTTRELGKQILTDHLKTTK
jgi:hypothetical protein